jgi:hypothetical protein
LNELSGAKAAIDGMQLSEERCAGTQKICTVVTDGLFCHRDRKICGILPVASNVLTVCPQLRLSILLAYKQKGSFR